MVVALSRQELEVLAAGAMRQRRLQELLEQLILEGAPEEAGVMSLVQMVVQEW